MDRVRPSTKDAILEAAFQTYNEHPAASLGDIADRAGVGRATLHRYFQSRETLMHALAQTATQELNEAIAKAVQNAESHTEGLRLALGATIPLANRQWFLAHEDLENDPEIAAAYEQEMKELREAIEEAREEGAFASDVPAKWIVEAYENLTYAAWSLVRDKELTPTQAADLAWRTLTDGLKGDTR